jgi:predicted CoA-binding protein
MLRFEQLLDATGTVLVVDWPSRDVPETLARAGYAVIVRGGPGPENYAAYEDQGGEIVVRQLGGEPEQVDVVYSHRPIEELPAIVSLALKLGAQAIWSQSGLVAPGQKDPRGCWISEDEAHYAAEVAEAAGLLLLHEPHIADAVRHRRT